MGSPPPQGPSPWGRQPGFTPQPGNGQQPGYGQQPSGYPPGAPYGPGFGPGGGPAYPPPDGGGRKVGREATVVAHLATAGDLWRLDQTS